MEAMKKLAFMFMAVCCTTSADPLFESEETLSIELHAPFRTIEREDDKDLEWPAALHLDDAVFDVKLSLRGNNRLSNCRFPPLRVDFDKDQINDTLFDKQNDIKLVVQCENGASYLDYLRTEYLIYKAMLVLTPMAYQVRWADVTYMDTDRARARQAPAFFVERKTRVAKRRDVDKTDAQSIDPRALRPEQAALTTLFAYLISNVDYSIVDGPGEEECCHNAKVLIDGAGRYYPILYDFDNSGLVDSSYSTPQEALGQYRVTQRLYRGICIHNEAARDARALFIDNAATIAALFEDDAILSSRQKRKIQRFLEEGFDTFREDEAFEKEIINECRG